MQRKLPKFVNRKVPKKNGQKKNAFLILIYKSKTK